MTEIKFFLASSSELLEEREVFEKELSRRSEEWQKKRGLTLKLVTSEKLSDKISIPRKQDDYNKHLRPCDIVVILCWHKTGPYTEEEFDNAYDQLLKNSKNVFNYLKKDKPSIHVYFKKIEDQIPVEKSLEKFKIKVNGIGHFETYFSNSIDLWNQFYDELENKDYPIKSVKSSIWIGIVGLVLALVLGLHYYQNVPGKLFDLVGQRYILIKLFLFGLSIGALSFGLMDVIQKFTKHYFISEWKLAITSAVVTIIVGYFALVPPVTIYHIHGKVLDKYQKAVAEVELNVEGTKMVKYSDSEGNYNFTFTNCPRDSLFTIVTSHTKHEDASMTFNFASSELSKDIILTPVHP